MCSKLYHVAGILSIEKREKKIFDHANSVDQKASEEEFDTEVSRFEHVIY